MVGWTKKPHEIFKVTALTLLPCTRKSTGGLPPAALQASIGIYLFIYFDSLNCHVHLCHQTTDLCKVTTFLFTLISLIVISNPALCNPLSPSLSGKCFLFNLSLINIDDTEWYWEILLACLCARGSGLMASLWDQSTAVLILKQFSYFSQQGHIIRSVDFDNNWYFSSTQINRWQC